MVNYLNEQSIRIFTSKIFHLLNYTLPGFFTLEVFFKRGLFSQIPETLFEFILLLLWAFIFSLPYNLFSQFSVNNVVIKAKQKARKKIIALGYTIDNDLKTADEKIEIDLEKAEKYKEFEATVQFVYVNIFLFFSYITYKYLTSHYTYESVWNINKMLIVYFNTLIVFYAIIYLPIFIITKTTINIYINQVVKEQVNSYN